MGVTQIQPDQNQLVQQNEQSEEQSCDWVDLVDPMPSFSSAPAPDKSDTVDGSVMGSSDGSQMSLNTFLGAKGLGKYVDKLIEVTDAESVADLKMIDEKMIEEVVRAAELKILPAQKFRALITELRAADGASLKVATPEPAKEAPRKGTATDREEAQEPKVPPPLQECIAICIDRSGSMGTPFSTDRTRMEAVKQMFYAFRDRTETVGRGGHEIGLIQFDDTVERMLDLSRRLDRFEDIVDDMSERGLTAIFDSVIEAARMLAPVAKESPQTDLRVLVLTDGQNNKGHPAHVALERVREIGAIVDAIIVGDRPDPMLRKIVAATGGECYQINDLGEGFELLEAESVVSLRARRGGAEKPPRPSHFFPGSAVQDLAEIVEKDMTRGTAVKRAPALDATLASKKVNSVQDAVSIGSASTALAAGGGDARKLRRILKELSDVQKKDSKSWMHSGEGVHVFPAAEDLTFWRALIEGPPGSPFEGGVFALHVQLPSDYPLRPPRITFETPIYHCNVSDSGQVCLDLLYDKWSPALTVPKCLEAIRLLMQNPDTDNALRQWIAELTIAYQNSNGQEAKYAEKAQEATKRDAFLSVAGWQLRWGC